MLVCGGMGRNPAPAPEARPPDGAPAGLPDPDPGMRGTGSAPWDGLRSAPPPDAGHDSAARSLALNPATGLGVSPGRLFHPASPPEEVGGGQGPGAPDAPGGPVGAGAASQGGASAPPPGLGPAVAPMPALDLGEVAARGALGKGLS